MELLKRYWRALSDDARKPLIKAIIANIVLGGLLSFVVILLFSDIVFEGRVDDDTFAQRWAITGFIIFVGFVLASYCYYLVYRAHKAIKELLFSKPAPGRKTAETWTGSDGFLLAMALIGITSIAQVPVTLILAALAPGIVKLELNDCLWPVIGVFLGPIAAKRYIPLDDEAEAK